MGRAYEVRKASIQKTGAVKAKLYSMFAKEIYQAAKNGGTNIDSNSTLKRLVERAKSEQVPSDLVKRAIDKVNSGVDENYSSVRYEIYGPSGSTLIVDCLTDNVNRTLSYIRPALNKNNGKMGVSGSVTFMYDNLCIVSFNGMNEDEVMEAMINNDIDVSDIEIDEDSIVIYAEPSLLFRIKEAVLGVNPSIVFDIDEISMLPKDKVTLSGEDLDDFNKMYNMIDEIEDVQNIYHNVIL